MTRRRRALGRHSSSLPNRTTKARAAVLKLSRV
jgi:hypothetical protein